MLKYLSWCLCAVLVAAGLGMAVATFENEVQARVPVLPWIQVGAPAQGTIQVGASGNQSFMYGNFPDTQNIPNAPWEIYYYLQYWNVDTGVWENTKFDGMDGNIQEEGGFTVTVDSYPNWTGTATTKTARFMAFGVYYNVLVAGEQSTNQFFSPTTFTVYR